MLMLCHLVHRRSPYISIGRHSSPECGKCAAEKDWLASEAAEGLDATRKSLRHRVVPWLTASLIPEDEGVTEDVELWNLRF